MNQNQMYKIAAVLGRGKMISKFLQGGLRYSPMTNTNSMINHGIRQGVLPTWSKGPQAIAQMSRAAAGRNALNRQGLADAVRGYRKEFRPRVIGMNTGQLNAARPGVPTAGPVGKSGPSTGLS